jgi:hypothetical protein
MRCMTIDGVWIRYWIYWHNSELQVITAPLLISIIHRLPQHPLSLFPACCAFNSRSLATASNSGDSSASRAHVVILRRISRNWNLVNLTITPSLLSLFCRTQHSWTHSPTNQLLHFTSLHWTELPQPAWGPHYVASGQTQQKTPPFPL